MRDKIIFKTALMGIGVNVLLFGIKLTLGLLSHSIAIISEAVNSATDVISSVLMIIGNRLSLKHPDKQHPFGYGRIEYLISLLIAAVFLVSGSELLGNSITLVIHGSDFSISVLVLVILCLSCLLKLGLAFYVIARGKECESAGLKAVGKEFLNDSLASLLTVVVSVIYLYTNRVYDAYVGIIISMLLMKNGIELLKDTAEDLLGRKGKYELAKAIYQEVRKEEYIVSAADLILHNYGPERYHGSLNVEIDHKKTVGEVYKHLHDLQLRIMHEYKVVMVFGIYAVDNDNEDTALMRKRIAAYINNHSYIRSYHALYISAEDKCIYLDFIVDYGVDDWQKIEDDFREYLLRFYPDYCLDLVVETEYI